MQKKHSTKLKHLILGVTIVCSSSVISQEYYELMNQEGVKLKTVQEAAEQYFGDITSEGISKVTGEKISGYKPYKRWEYHAQKHLKADGTIQTKKEIADAIQSSRTSNGLAAKSSATNATAVSNWTELGPLAMTYASGGFGHGNGRLMGMDISSDEQTIYVTSIGGGLWKSTNGANSWSPLGDDFIDMDIWSVEVDPNNADIVYTGNSIGQVFKSTNGGASFSTFFEEIGRINDILINPNNSDEIFVGSSQAGLFKTTDGGSTWTNTIIDELIEDIEYMPGSTSTIYACGDDFYRSSDSGDSFNQVTNGIVASDRMRMAVSPDNSDYVYIIQADGGHFGWLYRSTDQGVSFSLITEVSENVLVAGQAWRNMVIAVNPSNADEVHAGGLSMKKSLDGGVTFEDKTSRNNRQDLAYLHADQMDTEYVNGNLYITSDGGISKSTDGGETWIDIAAGLGVQQFYCIDSSPTNRNIVAGGAQDNGLTMTTGTAYDWYQWAGLDGMTTVINPDDPNIMYGMSQGGGLRKTVTGGQTRDLSFVPTPENNAGNWVTPMGIDPFDSKVIYAGYDDLYRHDNEAISGDWVNCSANFEFEFALDHIEMCPSNANVIYVADLYSLYKSSNIKSSSPTWTEITPPFDDVIVYDIGVDPDNEDRVVIAARNGDVFESTDGGSSWTAIGTGLPTSLTIKTLELDRSENNGIYVGFNSGAVFYKSDIVTNWTSFNTNLPNVEIEDLDLYYGTNGERLVRVGTYGRGIWESPMYDDTIAGENTSLAVDTNGTESLEADNVLIYPNPVSKQMQVQLPTQGETVVLSISDLNGRIINVNKFDTHDGLNLLKVDTELISEGVYLLEVFKGVKKTTKKIIIQKENVK